MAQLNFDARTVVPDTGQQDPVPAGWYNVVIDKSEMKPTKDGTGMRLELQFKIIDGQFVNRKIFEGLNLKNVNPVAQEIAYKQLSAIAHAVKVLIVEDSSQMHNIPLKVKVKLKAATGQYDAGNSIVAYKDINEVVTQPVAAPGAPAPFGGAPAAFGMPPAPAAFGAAPAAFAPQAAPPAQWAPPAAPAAPAQAAPQWAPPAAQQPWAPPAAPVQAAPAAPQYAPAPAPAPTPTAGLAPPAWATAPAAAPVQETAPVQAAAPVPSSTDGVVPPWLQAPAA